MALVQPETPIRPSRPALGELAGLAGLARPVAPAEDRLLPVLEPLAPLLPGGGLRRGTVVGVSASTSLALALLAGASAGGSWCGAVGLPSLGVVAAAELGVALERFPLVAAPAGGEEWAWAVAALLDAVDVVLARPPSRVNARDARRLAARARERSAVLVVSAASMTWPEAVDVRLEVESAAWEGVGEGHGRLRARRVGVVAGGRGAAARARRATLWLPGPDGGVATAPAAVPVAVPAAAVRATG